ncbi:SRPBCC domain-containing protein [uncultured Fluviicola sp.]|uniref:SRPBCC domain-containing protein n=1 Tax=uncultured Fluviicola sp. TaxID=463303 RepID=UPI00345D705D
MNSNLLFDFSVNKENNTIHVTRDFAANRSLVWDAWTKPELLDLWWAPKPFLTQTKSMDFREGGMWHYAMISPENEVHWCKLDYQTIENQKSYSGLDGFCDEHGTLNEAFPRSQWNNVFSDNGENTTVNITIKYETLEDLEKIISYGFKEGFSMAMENLDQYIEMKFKLRNELKPNRFPRVCTYLNFPGNTEEAFLFYQSVFKTEFSGKGIQRFGDIPADGNHPPVAESVKKMILHVELPITGHHVLMGTDAPKEMGFELNSGNNMHISIEPETREEAKRIFDELSAGGRVTMPLEDMFFGAYYGSFTDKFGVNWMVNHTN